jgi:hypothetical protein
VGGGVSGKMSPNVAQGEGVKKCHVLFEQCLTKISALDLIFTNKKSDGRVYSISIFHIYGRVHSLSMCNIGKNIIKNVILREKSKTNDTY